MKTDYIPKLKFYKQWLQIWRLKQQIIAHGMGVLLYTDEQIDNPKLGDNDNS